ncbi:MAG TPA: acetyl-CoA carboxylase biotin carboxylase subunit [Vicinamibacterales bacterium]|nr:acetyl-CoA carboxylase biotin carboxylase subunit [Vicinamibacterales bacterium]
MLKRLLIANRGEIARRIIRACRELGVETVAVYSEADAKAPYVGEADRAVRIGPAPARESYLNIDAIITAARESGADSVHPGYGFLSERAPFARACEDAGLIFVGPPSSSLLKMGSKIGARKLLTGAGVPVVPGETPSDQSDASLTAAAGRVGFPVLIKPSSGGGGIGMKVARSAEQMAEALAAARREAKASFGDDTLFIERLIEQPRHVEIQVFADNHGNVVHLFERECSAQRRHQKMLEESPCQALSPSVRARMGEAAIATAKAVDYRNAGTCEFLLEGSGDSARFYFLEMNTRLQVEHPVTECVTGVDLVHAQLRVASGEPLPFTQEGLSQRGHAIECRIYAEDPSQGFLPQAGTLERYSEPQGPGIRVDSGVRQGSEVSVFYDPMLAKLIVHAETRDAARRRALTALDNYSIAGIRTNIELLKQILVHPQFVDAAIDTGFLDREVQALVANIPAIPDDEVRAVDAPPASTVAPKDPFIGLSGWRIDGRTTWSGAATSSRTARRQTRNDSGVMSPMPATVVAIKTAAGEKVAEGDTVIVLEAMKMELPIKAPRSGVVKAIHCAKGDLVQPNVTLLEIE